MTGRALASDYLSAIERGDLDAILALFRPGRNRPFPAVRAAAGH